MWDVETGALLQSIGIGRPFAGLAISPDNQYAVIGFDDSGAGVLEVWDLESEQRVDAIAAHTDRVTELAFADDGRLLMSCGADKRLNVWNFAQRTKVAVRPQQSVGRLDRR